MRNKFVDSVRKCIENASNPHNTLLLEEVRLYERLIVFIIPCLWNSESKITIQNIKNHSKVGDNGLAHISKIGKYKQFGWNLAFLTLDNKVDSCKCPLDVGECGGIPGYVGCNRFEVVGLVYNKEFDVGKYLGRSFFGRLGQKKCVVYNDNIGSFCILADTVEEFFLAVRILGDENTTIIGAELIDDRVFLTVPRKLIEFSVPGRKQPERSFGCDNEFDFFTDIGFEIPSKEEQAQVVRTSFNFGHRKILESFGSTEFPHRRDILLENLVLEGLVLVEI